MQMKTQDQLLVYKEDELIRLKQENQTHHKKINLLNEKKD